MKNKQIKCQEWFCKRESSFLFLNENDIYPFMLPICETHFKKYQRLYPGYKIILLNNGRNLVLNDEEYSCLTDEEVYDIMKSAMSK